MKKKLLLRLSAAQFGMVEARLFLDTHPSDADALALFEKYEKKYNALKEEYEQKYGPLTLNGKNSDDWLNDPWPWDTNFNTADGADNDAVLG